MKALSDPNRLKILHALEHHEMCVSEIHDLIGGSQANVSKHLARMRQSGLLEARREGTNRVDPGGGSFRVVILDDSAETYKVKSVHGPYQSR